jgi:hypothetical protein
MGRLEETLAQPFSDLDAAAVAAGSRTAPTSYSDAVATPDRLLVFMARYDGDDVDTDSDPFTGGDEGLLWIQVAIEDTDYALETVIGR